MTYRECIWDHAAGALIAHEAGCEVSDAAGRALDFAAGRRLERNAGIVCAPPALHRTIASALAGTSLG
jgi:3'(2'), 5'-bisphosphate nucleotidase